MTEWKPGWWARAFRGAGSWVLSIREGRLRVCGIPREVDADVIDVLGLAVDEGSGQLIVTLVHGTETVLNGLSRRAVREVAAAYHSELDERRHLAALLSKAEEQGEAASLWWSRVRDVMDRLRWADQDTIAALEGSRPDVAVWLAVAVWLHGRRALSTLPVCRPGTLWRPGDICPPFPGSGPDARRRHQGNGAPTVPRTFGSATTRRSLPRACSLSGAALTS